MASRPVRRESRLRLMAARNRAGEAVKRLPNHVCSQSMVAPGFSHLVKALAWAYAVREQDVRDGLEHLATQLGACPVCVLAELFSDANEGAPLWFGRVLDEAYDRSELRPESAQLTEQLGWAAMVTLGAKSEAQSRHVLARASRPIAQA